VTDREAATPWGRGYQDAHEDGGRFFCILPRCGPRGLNGSSLIPSAPTLQAGTVRLFASEPIAMRSFLALGLWVALCASANAATVHRSGLQGVHLRTGAIIYPDQDVTPPARFAVPSWSDEQTQQWLDNASAGSGLG
jgi:hypothetical protein